MNVTVRKLKSYRVHLLDTGTHETATYRVRATSKADAFNRACSAFREAKVDMPTNVTLLCAGIDEIHEIVGQTAVVV